MNIVSIIKPHPLFFLPPVLGKDLSHNSQALRARGCESSSWCHSPGSHGSFFQILPSKDRVAVPLIAWGLTASVSPVVFPASLFYRCMHSLDRVLPGSGLKHKSLLAGLQEGLGGKWWLGWAPVSVSRVIVSGLLSDAGRPVLCSLESLDQMSYHHNEQTAHHRTSAWRGKGRDRAIRTWAKLWVLLQVCGGAEQLGGEGRCLYLPPSLLSQARGASCQLTQTQGILLRSVSACGRGSRDGSVDLEVGVGSMQISKSGAVPEAPACLSTGCL